MEKQKRDYAKVLMMLSDEDIIEYALNRHISLDSRELIKELAYRLELKVDELDNEHNENYYIEIRKDRG